MGYGINFGITIHFLPMMEIEYGIFIKAQCIVLMEVNISLFNLLKKLSVLISLRVDRCAMRKDVCICLTMIIMNIL